MTGWGWCVWLMIGAWMGGFLSASCGAEAYLKWNEQYNIKYQVFIDELLLILPSETGSLMSTKVYAKTNKPEGKVW